MALTEAQIKILRDSWAVVAAKGDFADIGVAMFSRLFSQNPELIPVFPFAKGDIEDIKRSPRVRKHGKSVITMVDAAVAGLDDIPALLEVLKALGKRHQRYGTTPAHFGPVANALLFTLEEAIGKGWTPETKEAWVTVYGVISATMSAEL